VLIDPLSFLIPICMSNLTLFIHSKRVSKFSFSRVVHWLAREGSGHVYVLGVSILSRFLLDFDSVPTVCYFSFFILSSTSLFLLLLLQKKAMYIYFNNILVISWLSVLLVEEIGVPDENNRPDSSY
jgi:hypothetical protein